MSALRILLASVLLAACLTEVPKPPSPQFGQLGPLFFGRQKQRFARMTEFVDVDNDGCNDNYDDNRIMVNLMMIMTKITKNI